MDLAKHAAVITILAVTLLAGYASGGYVPLTDAQRESRRQEIVPFIGRQFIAHSPIQLADKPVEGVATRPVSGIFTIDAFAGFNKLDLAWVHAIFADGTSGYFTTYAFQLSTYLYFPPPPPAPLTYPSFIDRLPVQEAARRHLLPGVRLGMTEAEVLASAWGQPNRTQEFARAKSDRVCWYYPHENMLCFSNGRLHSIEK